MGSLLARVERAGTLGRFVAGIYRRQDWYVARLRGLAAASLVRAYRPLLRNCEFIAVTGSCGKTTAKELIAGVLASRFRGTKSPENLNQFYHTAPALLQVRPGDRYNVQEVGIGKYRTGVIDRALALIRPTIGVVTNIGSDHISSYGSVEAIAREKRKLIEGLPKSGTAVLNADDPLVMAMRDHCKARVLTYGVAPEAMVRARNISAIWPARLSFTASYRDQVAAVETDLCGEHWTSAALAAITTGIAMGMSLAETAQAIRSVPPFANRMCPTTRTDGVTFVFDDAKSPYWTIPFAFAFMRDARAARRFIVMGTISDYMGASERAHVSIAKEALKSADHVVFVGSKASKALPARKAAPGTPLHAFYSIDAASEHLAGLLRPGDLVLLKGIPMDRLARICARPAQERPAAAVVADADPAPEDPAQPPDVRRPWIQAVVGFGNQGDQYDDSPHNVGREVVDLLARFFGAAWTPEPEAQVATASLPGGTVYLIKPRVNVNDTGPALKSLSGRLGFGPADCVLVHDDLNLDPGVIRSRVAGNDGGHNGVRSVLSAFSSIEFRRVKIGVGRPGANSTVYEHVLTPMTADRLATMRDAYVAAAHRTLTVLAFPKAPHTEMMRARTRFEEAHSACLT